MARPLLGVGCLLFGARGLLRVGVG
jgi:hypothetical protein